MNAVHFSSETVEHATPQDFFDTLNATYNFTLDPCATVQNAKCAKFYTREQDGLAQSWANEVVFMNPPYGDAEQPCRFTSQGILEGSRMWGTQVFVPLVNAKGEQVGDKHYTWKCQKSKCLHRRYHVSEYIPGIKDWVRKAYESAKNENALVVSLLPARTDTKYWHIYVWDKGKKQWRRGVKGNFEEGRLRFGDAKASAPFPSAVVEFNFRPRLRGVR